MSALQLASMTLRPFLSFKANTARSSSSFFVDKQGLTESTLHNNSSTIGFSEPFFLSDAKSTSVPETYSYPLRCIKLNITQDNSFKVIS